MRASILEFDEKGRLRLLVENGNMIQWFEWKTIKGRQVMTSGLSIDNDTGRIMQLFEVGTAPPPLTIIEPTPPASACDSNANLRSDIKANR